jgi:ribulose-phosphate 3-epimerase
MPMIKVSTSLLSARPDQIMDEVKALCKCGTDSFHLDIMDGVFVPNTNMIDDQTMSQLTQSSSVPVDAHLMVKRIKDYAEYFIRFDVNSVIVHLESDDFSLDLLKELSLKTRVGVSIKPATPASALQDVLPYIESVLVMTVEPGFGGQAFLHSQLDKIRAIKKMIEVGEHHVDIAVDGGINRETAALCVEAGANTLISGSYILGSADYKSRIDTLRDSNIII